VDVSKAELTLCLVWPDRLFERPLAGAFAGADSAGGFDAAGVEPAVPRDGGDGIIGTYGDAFRQGWMMRVCRCSV